MIYTKKAIETRYRGHTFRSRLECKWASLFDMCGWKWGYEPAEQDGWIPDFVLGELFTLVEVKPFYRSEQWQEATTKIEQSGYSDPVILLGDNPLMLSDHCEGRQLGWLYEPSGCYGTPGGGYLQPLHFGMTEGNDRPGLCPMAGGWTNYIWDVPKLDPSDRYYSHTNKWSRVADDPSLNLTELWGQATQTAKWMPSR